MSFSASFEQPLQQLFWSHTAGGPSAGAAAVGAAFMACISLWRSVRLVISACCSLRWPGGNGSLFLSIPGGDLINNLWLAWDEACLHAGE